MDGQNERNRICAAAGLSALLVLGCSSGDGQSGAANTFSITGGSAGVQVSNGGAPGSGASLSGTGGETVGAGGVPLGAG